MSVTPTHKIIIVHGWKEIDRNCSETGSATVVEKCQHCGTERRGLILDLTLRPGSEDTTLTESSFSQPNFFSMWEEAASSIKEMFEQLVQDTSYDTVEDVIDEIEKLGQRAIDGSKLPYWQLQRWIARPRSYKVQSLLEVLQGPVCNRCDEIFSNTVEPTVDHINGDRSNAHPSNLQLLCKICNGEKGKNPQNECDKSPFTYEGDSCEHKLTCIELEALQSHGDNDGKELA